MTIQVSPHTLNEHYLMVRLYEGNAWCEYLLTKQEAKELLNGLRTSIRSVKPMPKKGGKE